MVQPGWSSKCFFSCFYKSMRNTPVCLKTENTRLSFIWSPLHVGSIWLIQVSIVTLLAGHVICHTQAIKRGQNQNKPKLWSVLANIRWIWQTSSYWKNCITFAYFGTRRGSLHPKRLAKLIFKDVGKVKNLGITWNLEVLEACSMPISDVGFIGNTHWWAGGTSFVTHTSH